MTGMERLVTVYNPRDSDALAKAKSLVRGYKWQKVMLLLPRIDLAYKESDPEVLAELDALIESTSERTNVLVVATATTFEPDSDLDNSFGIKLALPGAEVLEVHRREIPEDAQQMLAQVARFYLDEAQRTWFRTAGRLSGDEFCRQVLACAMNPAEIEDIVVLCETTALFRRRSRSTARLVITPEILAHGDRASRDRLGELLGWCGGLAVLAGFILVRGKVLLLIGQQLLRIVVAAHCGIERSFCARTHRPGQAVSCGSYPATWRSTQAPP